MNLERPLLSAIGWPLHRLALRITGSRLGIDEPSGRRMGTLLLTTTGRRSGEQRARPVHFMRDDERLVVVASNAGDDRDPAWWLNLQAHPVASVRTRAGVTEVTARPASAEERRRLWPELVRRNPGYARYERRTERPIPVVILEPSPS